MAKGKIGAIPKTVAKLFLSIAKPRVLELVEKLHFKKMVENAFDIISSSVEVYSDDDLDNKSQMQSVWYDYSPKLFTDTVEVIEQEGLSKINNDDIKQSASFLLTRAAKVAELLTDDDQDNEAQLKELLEENKIPAGEQGLELIIKWVEKWQDSPSKSIMLAFLKEIDLEDIFAKGE